MVGGPANGLMLQSSRLTAGRPWVSSGFPDGHQRKDVNQEKSVLNVLADDGSALVIGDRDGEAQTYHLNTDRVMCLHIRQLEVSRHQGNQAGLPGLDDDKRKSLAAVPYYVRGRASIERGSISVIGAPTNRSTILDFGFSPFDEDVYRKRQAWAREWGTTVRYTQATLGFVRHPQSASASDDWFVECELAADALRALAGAVRVGRLQAMTIGLVLGRIYSDDWAPTRAHTNWFLRPNRRDNNCDDPEMAHGDVTRLCFDLAPFDLRPLSGAHAEPKENTQAGPMSA